MRQFFMVTLVAVAAGLLPAMVRADSPNQEAAQKISDHLTKSGQLVFGDKIAVRYLNGTVWLQGHVHNQEQLNKAVAVVFATEGVVINQVVRDELMIDGAKPGSAANPSATKTVGSAANPLRGSSDMAADVNRVQALPSSFSASHATTPVAMMQPVAAPEALPAPAAASGVPGAAVANVRPGHRRGRCGAGALRPSGDAGLRLAELCRVSKLCGVDLSQAVLADGLAVHRSLLSVSASSLRLAKG